MHSGTTHHYTKDMVSDVCVFYLYIKIFLAPDQAYMASQQHQINPISYPMMLTQVQNSQRELSQCQVCLSKQQTSTVLRSDLIFTSAGPVFSSVNIPHLTSQFSIPTYSVTPQSTTMHTTVTTVQYNSYNQQQQNSGKYVHLAVALKTTFLI